MNVIMIAPAIVLGMVGGIFGAIFTRLNNFIAKSRVKLVGKIPHPLAQKLVKFLEVLLLAVSTICCHYYGKLCHTLIYLLQKENSLSSSNIRCERFTGIII